MPAHTHTMNKGLHKLITDSGVVLTEQCYLCLTKSPDCAGIF